jgi:hypothetical protein
MSEEKETKIQMAIRFTNNHIKKADEQIKLYEKEKSVLLYHLDMLEEIEKSKTIPD